jgi:hypothetical protein
MDANGLEFSKCRGMELESMTGALKGDICLIRYKRDPESPLGCFTYL